MKIYMIAQDESFYENGDSYVETRVAHNLGAWEDRGSAEFQAEKLNKKRENNPEETENDSVDGDYFVIEIGVK
jgi:hypothetical protein